MFVSSKAGQGGWGREEGKIHLELSELAVKESETKEQN